MRTRASYSARNASEGGTHAAFRAGRYAAARETARRSPPTRNIVSGSVTSTSKSSPSIRRDRSTTASTPDPKPARP